jgi:hypothetical protein
VLEAVHYRVDPANRDAFLAAMREVRQVRLRAGALVWRLYEDVARPDRWTRPTVRHSLAPPQCRSMSQGLRCGIPNLAAYRGRPGHVANYELVWAEPDDGVRWESLQQHTMAALPAAAAPANRTKVPAAAVPVSTVAQSNNLLMAFSPAFEATFVQPSRQRQALPEHATS